MELFAHTKHDEHIARIHGDRFGLCCGKVEIFEGSLRCSSIARDLCDPLHVPRQISDDVFIQPNSYVCVVVIRLLLDNLKMILVSLLSLSKSLTLVVIYRYREGREGSV